MFPVLAAFAALSATAVVVVRGMLVGSVAYVALGGTAAWAWGVLGGGVVGSGVGEGGEREEGGVRRGSGEVH